MRPLVNYPISLYLRKVHAQAQATLAQITAEPERFQLRTLRRILAAQRGHHVWPRARLCYAAVGTRVP